MKRRILFILFILGLSVCAVGFGALTPDNSGEGTFGEQELDLSLVGDCNSMVSCDVEIDDPVASIILTNVNNIHTGYVRTVNRYMRLRYIYCPNAILKGGKVVDISVIRRFLNSRNVFYTVRLSSKYSFILFCKLLI